MVSTISPAPSSVAGTGFAFGEQAAANIRINNKAPHRTIRIILLIALSPPYPKPLHRKYNGRTPKCQSKCISPPQALAGHAQRGGARAAPLRKEQTDNL